VTTRTPDSLQQIGVLVVEPILSDLSIAPWLTELIEVLTSIRCRHGLKGSSSESPNQEISSGAARKILGISPSDFVVGSVGRLAFGKGLETLIIACGLLSDKIPELKLVIVGSCALEGKLRDLASQRLSPEKVIFTGWVDRPNEVFPAMDVFVSASSSEAGISAALIEAMANELACVLTPLTDFVKTLQNGIVVSKPDPPELARVLVMLHDTPILRKTLGRNAKLSAEHALRIYDWQAYCTKVSETISSLLGRVADEASVEIC